MAPHYPGNPCHPWFKVVKKSSWRFQTASWRFPKYTLAFLASWRFVRRACILWPRAGQGPRLTCVAVPNGVLAVPQIYTLASWRFGVHWRFILNSHLRCCNMIEKFLSAWIFCLTAGDRSV